MPVPPTSDPTPQPDRQPTLIDPAQALTEGLALGPPIPHEVGEDVLVDRGARAATGGTVLVDRYELSSVVGSGATAEVWLANDRLLGRLVAVKRLLPQWRAHPEVAERFRREGQVTARLRHPAIVGVLDAGIDEDGVGFQVMELVQGQSLSEQIAGGHALAPLDVVDLGLVILGGLGHAHEQGLVHRDVKPGNILMENHPSGSPTPRLTDFGVAKALDAGLDLTATGIVVGTAAYLAPEQATGDPVDHRADLYALGCVLYECLTGSRPFDGGSPVQVASARIGAHVRPSDRMPDVPAILDAVIARAMAPAPADRFATAEEMADALDVALEDLGVTAVPADVSDGTGHRAPVAPLKGTDSLVRAEPMSPPGAMRLPGGGRHVGREVVVLGAAVLLALVAVAGIGLSRLGAEDPVAAASEAPIAAEDAPVAIAGVSPFDPQGDGGEHTDELGLLIDGDAATAWTTEGYSSANFGNLKPGVGAVVDLGEPRTLREARLLGITPGTNVEIRVSAASPTSLDQTVVAGVVQSGPDAAVALADAEGVQFVILWIVPPLPQEGGRFRGGIGELQLFS